LTTSDSKVHVTPYNIIVIIIIVIIVINHHDLKSGIR
jgi:hypothetical protein